MNIKKQYSNLLSKIKNIYRDLDKHPDLVKDIKYFDDFIENYNQLNYQTEKLTRTGVWKYDLQTQSLLWTKGVYDIHELAYETIPSVDKAISFYEKKSQAIISKALEESVKFGKPFNHQLTIITQTGKKVDVEAHGNVLIDNNGKINAV